MATCSLSAADFADDPPQVYADMMREGRSKISIGRIHSLVLKSKHPVNVFVSQDLIADVKALKYGFNGSLDFYRVTVGFHPSPLPQNKPHLAAAATRTGCQGPRRR
jgi:hypothetical protein